jgi:hypothetical protein
VSVKKESFQTLPGSDHFSGVAHAGHGTAVFQRPDDQTVEREIPHGGHRQGGGDVHAADYPQQFLEFQDEDLRHDPVLSESNSLLIIVYGLKWMSV